VPAPLLEERAPRERARAKAAAWLESAREAPARASPLEPGLPLPAAERMAPARASAAREAPRVKASATV
jgi:hypothetical protein